MRARLRAVGGAATGNEALGNLNLNASQGWLDAWIRAVVSNAEALDWLSSGASN